MTELPVRSGQAFMERRSDGHAERFRSVEPQDPEPSDGRAGSMPVMTAVMLRVPLMSTALGVEVTHWSATKLEMQTIADVSAWAGAAKWLASHYAASAHDEAVGVDLTAPRAERPRGFAYCSPARAPARTPSGNSERPVAGVIYFPNADLKFGGTTILEPVEPLDVPRLSPRPSNWPEPRT